jgi:TRAP-type C4-dicarboxylate transport system permease small subunit
MPLQPVLDYEPLPPKLPPGWRRSLVCWVVVCIVGYCFALIGPLFAVAGIQSFYIDPSGSLRWSLFGMPVYTLTEKLVWTLSSGVVGAIGLCFVAYTPPSQLLHRRGITRQCSGPEPRV